VPATTHEPVVLSEEQQVVLHRYTEARAFGFTMVEARLYAESDIDCGKLRVLKLSGCGPAMAAKILL